jgi:hypothetical protein
VRAETVIQPQGDYELESDDVFTGTIGETIRVPTNGDTSLVSFAIGIANSTGSLFRSNLLAEVYAWDGSEATGPALYTSPLTPIAIITNGSTFVPSPTFETGGINLTASAEYVIFLDVIQTDLRKWGITQIFSSRAPDTPTGSACG